MGARGILLARAAAKRSEAEAPAACAPPGGSRVSVATSISRLCWALFPIVVSRSTCKGVLCSSSGPDGFHDQITRNRLPSGGHVRHVELTGNPAHRDAATDGKHVVADLLADTVDVPSPTPISHESQGEAQIVHTVNAPCQTPGTS
jgi:hypothetical protein